MRTVLGTINSISEWSGRLISWLVLFLFLVGTYDAIMRFVFNAPTMWAYETMMMLGGVIYLGGWAYDCLHKSHIRIDLFYTKLPPRKRALLDVVCAMIFFFPLMAILIKTSTDWAWYAWSTHEVMSESFWYPPAGPFRTAIAVGICLFFLQGSAQFIRDFYFVVKGKPYD
ncbi:hypothetical protein ES705_08825 [subsurface metagenome]